jgi:hypothetical protein
MYSSSLCEYKNNPKPVEFLIDENYCDGNALVLKHISRDDNENNKFENLYI